MLDGRPDGTGFAPAYESLAKLRDGGVLHAFWPEREAPEYSSWSELMTTLRDVVDDVCAGYAGPLRMYAPDPDPIVNVDDHSDHRLEALAVQELCAWKPALQAAWVSMYAATVAGTVHDWRRGWERELEMFKNRQYIRFEDTEAGFVSS